MEKSLQRSRYQDSVVVIPAYCPSHSLVDLTQRLSKYGYPMIVVDDGSGEEYNALWEQLPKTAVILHHRENMGKGAALKSAFRRIRDDMPQVGCIITMDADGQHLPQDMEHVALCAWTNPGTLVLGARNFDEDIPLRSKLGNKITKVVFSRIAGETVQDTQTGLRAFDRSLLDYMLERSGCRYEYEMNVLLHCKEYGVPITEVPIQTVYLDKKNSSSHFNGVKDSFRIYRNILKFASASFVSFLADYVLFLLFAALSPDGTVFLLLSNALARLGSASLNYTLNTKAVFRGHRSAAQTLPQYAGLALVILAGNSLILALLVKVLGIPSTAAKIMTEIILFVLSFLVQSRIIFKKQATEKGGLPYVQRHSA